MVSGGRRAPRPDAAAFPDVASTSSGLSAGGAGRSGCAEGAGPERRAEDLADEGSVGGMESADGRTRQAGLDGFATAPGSAGLGWDPQVAGVAALEFRDDPRPGAKPPGQDLHGRGTERARSIGKFDVCGTLQVQRTDVEPGEFGDGPAGI